MLPKMWDLLCDVEGWEPRDPTRPDLVVRPFSHLRVEATGEVYVLSTTDGREVNYGKSAVMRLTMVKEYEP